MYAGPIGSRGTRPTDIEPVEHLSDGSTSIEASTTEKAGDPKEHAYGVFADELETTKLILQGHLCVKNFGASR